MNKRKWPYWIYCGAVIGGITWANVRGYSIVEAMTPRFSSTTTGLRGGNGFSHK